MNKVAVISGADRGLGLALCKRFLAGGWSVFAGQYMSEWNELSGLCSQYPDRLMLIPMDVSSGESVKAAAKWVMEETDHVDLLISNAGIIFNEGGIREGLKLNQSQKMFDVNTLGPIRITEAFLPLMEKGLKRLCFVSSEAGSIGVCTRSGEFGYCMSKAALNMAVRIMYNDLYPKGFTFRLYHPGWLRTYMLGEKNLQATLEPEESAEAAFHDFVEDRAVEDQLTLIDHEGRAWPF